MEQTRPPIVTILGHVDHGKTTLLDFIRKSSIAAREHGGITQHVGAYQAQFNNKTITFIDTPGHAAFEKMRSRGASAADIAILVVAIDDGLMPQTLEATEHIKSAKVPMIVAVNKVDLPGINIKVQLDKIKKQLSDKGILVEEYGGDVPIIPLSAKTGEGVDKLLEMILLVAEMSELKGDPDSQPQGVVIESAMDKFKGPIATVLIKDGTLRKGEQVLIGGVKGKIRGLFDFAGKPIDQAGPSVPVEVLGLEGVPIVGALLGEDRIQATGNRQQVMSLIDKLKQDDREVLKVVVKADKQGSLEAIEDGLEKFNGTKKMVEIAAKGVGDISESDIKLASSVRAIVVGFNVKIALAAQRLAETDHVLTRNYNIIYELFEEMEEVVEGMLRPGKIEEILGRAEVVAEFPYGKNEKIAGCRVLEGGMTKNSKVRIKRGDEVIGEAKLKSLRKVKDEVNRVEKGSDCGMIFDPSIDFQIGDFVELYRII